MVSKLLIAIGLLLIISGIIGLLLIIIEPIKHSVIILFNREHLDHYHGDDELLVKERNDAVQILKKACIYFIGVGAVLLLIGLFFDKVTHGKDSLLSKFVAGFVIGDADVPSESPKNEQDKDKNNTNPYASGSKNDTNNIENDIIIAVNGNTIRFGEIEFEDMEEFSGYMNEFNAEGRNVFLKDDFAISKTYHEVEKILKELGINYN